MRTELEKQSARIRVLEDCVRALEEVLQPFAIYEKWMDADISDDAPVAYEPSRLRGDGYPTVGNCRRAKLALDLIQPYLEIKRKE